MTSYSSDKETRTENHKRALHHLFSDKSLKQAYWEARDRHHTELDTHPCGLETELHTDWGVIRKIVLIAHPGITDLSVNAMKCMLRGEICLSDLAPFRLRVVYVPIKREYDLGDGQKHDVYFEFITTSGTFICGGCNDCSGAGSSGTRELLGIFELIAFIFQIKLEKVTAEGYDADAVSRRLRDVYDRFEEEER